uniref:Integrase n=1 Tax=Rhizobium meliloti TaxID=382 RepID=I2E1F6_RHIML|nr:integrase [Sinorhizobium meliloti]
MQDALKSRSSSISPRFDTRGSVLHFVRGSVSHFARQEFQKIAEIEAIGPQPEAPEA